MFWGKSTIIETPSEHKCLYFSAVGGREQVQHCFVYVQVTVSSGHLASSTTLPQQSALQRALALKADWTAAAARLSEIADESVALAMRRQMLGSLESRVVSALMLSAIFSLVLCYF